MSNFPGSLPVLAEPYSPPSQARYGPGSGGFDPRATYAVPAVVAHTYPSQGYATAAAHGFPGHPAYDPYTSIGAAVQYGGTDKATLHQGSPSVSSTQAAGSGSSAAGAYAYAHSTVGDLKRRQQEVMASYEHGISGADPAPVEHIEPNPAIAGPTEFPPIYTPHWIRA